MSLGIRVMKESDAPTLHQITCDCDLTPWSEDSFIRECQNPLACYQVLEDDGSPVGFAGIWCVVDEAQVMDVAVLPSYGGQGWGKALMKSLLSAARDVGCITMTLEVKVGNTKAMALYRSLGFVEYGRRKDYYPDHSDALLMKRECYECQG